jgi:hypothetical protein
MYQTTCMYEFDGQAALCRERSVTRIGERHECPARVWGIVDSGKNYH